MGSWLKVKLMLYNIILFVIDHIDWSARIAILINSISHFHSILLHPFSSKFTLHLNIFWFILTYLSPYFLSPLTRFLYRTLFSSFHLYLVYYFYYYYLLSPFLYKQYFLFFLSFYHFYFLFCFSSIFLFLFHYFLLFFEIFFNCIFIFFLFYLNFYR